MEYISDRELLKTTLEKMGISGHFDSLGLQFHLVEYHKGELLVAPFKPMDQLLPESWFRSQPPFSLSAGTF